MTGEEWAAYCRWRPAFAEVIDQRYYSIEWLEGQLLSARAFFLCTPEAAIIYEIKAYPTGACDVHGLIAAGDLSDIVHELIPVVEHRGRSLGCVGALISSREGWSKVLRSSGYKPYQVEIRKEL